MAAGLGFKDFVTGEVLTAADVDGYLMQGVWVFASAAARDAAVTSPQEGNFAYLKDTNVTTYYTGSAWANLDTTGMTNPMTTTGDIIYSSPGSTPVRLGIGTANQVLTVNSGATAPEWKTPAGGGGKVLQVVQGTTSTNATISTSSFTDSNLTATITPTSASSKVLVIIAQVFRMTVSGSANIKAGMQLVRGATSIYNPGGDDTQFDQSTGSTGQIHQNIFSACYLDSPATTSATTYKTQLNSGDTVVAQNNTLSTITLLEIGA